MGGGGVGLGCHLALRILPSRIAKTMSRVAASSTSIMLQLFPFLLVVWDVKKICISSPAAQSERPSAGHAALEVDPRQDSDAVFRGAGPRTKDPRPLKPLPANSKNPFLQQAFHFARSSKNPKP